MKMIQSFVHLLAVLIQWSMMMLAQILGDNNG